MDKLEEWLRQVNVIMRDEYAITTVDAGLSKEELSKFFLRKQAPQDFVAWFANKYDLTNIAAWR